MDAKKIRAGASRTVAWLALVACSLIIKALPTRFLYGFARGLGAFGYRVAAKQRKIALESLAIAFGENKNEKEREGIARECFILLAKSGVELISLMDRPALLRQRVTFVGKSFLDQGLARGRGVILVSAHFGNFPLLMAKLSLEGYAVGGIMRHMRDERTEKLFLAKRDRLGVKTIYSQPRKVCVDNTLKALRDNEIVFIPIDQNFGTAGVFVNFFGTKAATATGPVILAQRTKAAVLPCFIVRQPDDTHRIIFEPPMDPIEGKSSEETIMLNIQKLTDIIESYIRQYPAEWGWMHRRWKSKPKA